MNVVKATKDYESWAGRHIPLVAADLKRKHKAMAAAAFPFLRATFYRWVQLWRRTCLALAEAPELLAVGDLHVENFGTWRDAEGRLVWGINDFDEAAPMPYALDLVRLAASALLARSEEALTIGGAEACAAILDGYAKGLSEGGTPFVLEEGRPALRHMALGAERDPDRFWRTLNACPDSAAAPDAVRALLAWHLPAPGLAFRLVTRIAGLGALGRPRFVALADWHGAMVAREAKAMVPSAYGWAMGRPDETLHYQAIVEHAVRCPDPCLAVEPGWLVRRLGPNCSRLELAQFPATRDERRILRAMGRETANIHLGTPAAIPAVEADLKRRKPGWLLDAATAMAAATRRDWQNWRDR